MSQIYPEELQIASRKQLKEYLSKVPVILVCISGKAVFKDEIESVIVLKSGDYMNRAPALKHSIESIE